MSERKEFLPGIAQGDGVFLVAEGGWHDTGRLDWDESHLKLSYEQGREYAYPLGSIDFLSNEGVVVGNFRSVKKEGEASVETPVSRTEMLHEALTLENRARFQNLLELQSSLQKLEIDMRMIGEKVEGLDIASFLKEDVMRMFPEIADLARQIIDYIPATLPIKKSGYADCYGLTNCTQGTVLDRQWSFHSRNNQVPWQTLFKQRFKIGDEVIIVTEYDDKFDWGRLDWDSKELRLLESSGRRGYAYSWDRLIFICHQGFPFRKLRGADGSMSALKQDNSKVEEHIRRALSERDSARHEQLWLLRTKLMDLKSKVNGTLPKLGEEIQRLLDFVPPYETPNRFGFGDPFEIECETMVLFNAGNSGPDFWYSSPWYETMAGYSGGAHSLGWDLGFFFYAE